MMNVHSPTVFTEDLGKTFNQVQALKNVNLDVSEGQIFGLLGPNGAGKTTLIRVLIGATKPSAGQVRVLGLEPTGQKRALREMIGYMPQEPALYEDLSPRENIRFFGAAHQVEALAARIDEVIAFVGLEARAGDPVFTFSGGMKQRVSLACALVHQPRMLFLDEPTSGIDPQLREIFWQHFRVLTSRGVTIIVSTHQMDEAIHCDHLAILRQGTVLISGMPREMLWNSRARLKIWRGEHLETHEVTNYPQQTPEVLRPYGLDPTISRIEIEEDTLETIVLRMINNQ